MKIFLLQPDLIWENIDRNLALFEGLFDQIPGEASMVILPEMYSTGFSMNPEQFSREELEKVPLWQQKMADKYEFAIGGSSIALQKGARYNRFYFTTPGGQISFYDKRHLFRMGEEQKHYYAGNERKIFEYNGWRIMPLICYDLRFPVWSRNQNDYDLLIYVANWPAVRQDAWETLLKARAIENQCYVIGVNRTGKDPKVSYAGGSRLFSPKGEVLSSFYNNNNVIREADLDMKMLQEFREKFPVWMDRDNFSIH